MSASKDRRRDALLKMLNSDPAKIAQLYALRCYSDDKASDAHMIEEILGVEFPDERTPEQIKQRDEREREELSKSIRIAKQIIDQLMQGEFKHLKPKLDEDE